MAAEVGDAPVAAAADDAPAPAPAPASAPAIDQETIRSFVEDLVKTADLQTLTVKGIREALSKDLGAQLGRDYEKTWLRTQVDSLLEKARMAAEAPKPEPAAAAPSDAGGTFRLGTVLWAKLQGYPFWPGMVVKPPKKLGKNSAPSVCVRFFGTHDHAFCETLLAWDDPAAKQLKTGLKVKKRDQKKYLEAVAEAEVEIASPTPLHEEEEEEGEEEEGEEEEGEEEGEEEAGEEADEDEAAERGTSGAAAADSSDDEPAPKAKPAAKSKPKPKPKPAPAAKSPKKKRAIAADSSDEEDAAAPAPAEEEPAAEEEDEEDEDEDEEDDADAEAAGDNDFNGGGQRANADSSDSSDSDDDAPKVKKTKGKRSKSEAGGKRAKAKAAREASGEPKRPSNAFMLFSNATRPALKAEQPGLSMGEFGKLLGERYRELSEEDKKHWQSLADADKVRYEEELAVFKANGGVTQAEQKRKDKGLQPKAPRKPRDPSKPPPERNDAKAKILAKEQERDELMRQIAKQDKMLGRLEQKREEAQKTLDAPEPAAEEKTEEPKPEEPKPEGEAPDGEKPEEPKPDGEAPAAAEEKPPAADAARKDPKAEATKMLADIAAYDTQTRTKKAKLEGELRDVQKALKALEAQQAEQAQKRKERAQELKRQQKEEAERAASKESKKPKVEPKPEKPKPKPEPEKPAAKAEPAPKRKIADSDDEDEPAPKKPKEEAGGAPLSAGELTSLLAKLARATEGDVVDEAAVKEVLVALETSRMTLDLLRSTGVGKVINKLHKKVPSLAARAQALVARWKVLATG